MRFCVWGARFPPLSGALFFLSFLVAGCAAPPSRAPVEIPPAQAPHAELSEVPFFAQAQFQCGPAALAMVLANAGYPVDPQALEAQVYLPARRGSMQVEMLAASRRNGALAVVIAPNLPTLLATVAEGHPVVVLQSLGQKGLPRWHYAVIIGYDLGSRSVVLRSGTTKRLVMSMDAFDRTWSHSGRWAMAALRPGQLPSTLDEREYLQAALDFEKLAAAGQSRQAYEAAVLRWPASRLAWLGAGNNAYRLADWAQAERAFARAAELPGDPAPALNNLALTLAAQGRVTEAIATAERAVAAGGPFESAARATLGELRTSAGKLQEDSLQ
jgi:tetratricopeptide (TPR) repeat protein